MLTDLKFALRQLLKSPGFTLVGVLTLAIGIGLNTSMFSLMNLLILQPLPFPDRDHLVRLYRTTPQSSEANHSAPDCVELTREMASFADVATYRTGGFTLAPEGRPSVNLNALRVSANFFPTLGLKPELGRFFRSDEDEPGNHVIILSYATWQAQFGGDPAVLGQNVRIDGQPTTIVGVMPATFSSVFLWGPSDAFRPLALSDVEKQNHGDTEYHLLARYHQDLSLAQLGSRLPTLAERLAPLRPKEHAKDGLRAVTLQSSTKSPAMVAGTFLLVGLAGFVLLITCANLAHLQLARSVARTHEFAIRAALGASRSRLLRPLLGESLLLSLAGGLLGVLVTVWANDWISSRLSANGFFTLTLSLDWRVLGFAVVLSVCTGLIFGLMPAWLMARVKVNDSLKSGTRGNTGDRAQHRLRHGLIVLQFALALVLLAGAAFFLKGLNQVMGLDPGWKHHAIAQAVLNLPPAKYASPAQTYAFYTRVQERLSALPGAEGATVGWTLPLYLFLTSRTFVVAGHEPALPGHEPLATVNGIAPSYLDALQIRLLSGRNFTEADSLTAAPVAIINESMAKALFPNESPLGRRIGVPDPKNQVWLEVVGVVPDIHMAMPGVPSTTPFQVLRPLAQETWNYVTVAVRGQNPEALVEPMRQAIAALDPDLAVQQLGTVDHAIKLASSTGEMINTVLIAFAMLGLFLAAVGLYGVIARLVVQRTVEIGVRVALGAQANDVVWLILRSGLKLTLLGTAIGLLGAVGLSRVLIIIFPRPDSVPATSNLGLFAGVTSLLLAIGLLACWLPARRASKVDPMVALRAE